MAKIAVKGAAGLWWLSLLSGVIALILGIFLISSPGMTTVVLAIFGITGGVILIVVSFRVRRLAAQAAAVLLG